MDRLRKSFVAIGFSGQYTIGLIDYRHIIIRFNLEEDYIRCFLKRTWSIDGFVMRVLKWHYKFSVDSECSIVPVWVKFPLLPLHLYNKEALYSIARLVGEPLKLDASTSSFNRPSVARVCVEIDLFKEPVTEVWITQVDFGFWQTVEYDELPLYCNKCNKVGHNLKVCRTDNTQGNSEMPKKTASQIPAAPSRLQWQLKQHIKEKAEPAVVISVTAEASSKALGQIESSTALGQDAHSPVLDVSTAAAVMVDSAMNAAVTDTADATAMLLNPAPDAAVVADPVLLAAMTSTDATDAVAADAAAKLLNPTPALAAVAADLDVAAVAVAVPISMHPIEAPRRAGLLDVASAMIDKECGGLNKDGVPKQSEKSYAAVLVGSKQDASPHPVSSKPRFYAIKSAEYPSLPLPNFRILNLSCPFFPQFVDEPRSPRPADDFQVHSDGDAVPRLPTPRKKLSASLRSFHRELNVKFKKGRVPYAYPVIRKKWTKLAPISLPSPASTQTMNSNKASASKDIPLNASDHYGQPHDDHVDEEMSDDDDSVEYESVWRSSSSDDEAAIDFDTQLALQESLMPMDYNDFSLSPPQHSRRKYTKRFRDLPPPPRTRSSRDRSL